MNNKTDITILLDRTGSMMVIKEDTIGGFNAFIHGQQKVDGECVVSLVQFDGQDPQEVVYEAKNIHEVPDLDDSTFMPRADTPLLDAIGTLIVNTGARLSAIEEGKRPDKILFVIITDGEENASREYTRDKILEMITHQTDVYKWEFVYLGANQDAIKEGAKLGIDLGHSMSYAHTGDGAKNLFSTLNKCASAYRTCANSTFAFSDEDRQTQDDLINKKK